MPPRLRGSTAADADARFTPGQKSPHPIPLAPIDLPDDFGFDNDDRPSFPITLMTGIAIGILMGLALGELWSMIGGASS